MPSLPLLSIKKRKLAIVAILAATVLSLVTTPCLAIGSVLAVKTGATHKIKSSNGSNIGGKYKQYNSNA